MYSSYIVSLIASPLTPCWVHYVYLLKLPEELIEISMLHIFKDHDEWVPIHTNTIEFNYVLMLQVGQQFSLTLEILPGSKSGVLKSLKREREREVTFTHSINSGPILQEGGWSLWWRCSGGEAEEFTSVDKRVTQVRKHLLGTLPRDLNAHAHGTACLI